MRAQITSVAILAMLFGATIASTKFGDEISAVPDGKGGSVPLGVTTFGGFVTVDAKNGGALYYWYAREKTGQLKHHIFFRSRSTHAGATN